MEFICSTADCSPPLRIAQLLTSMFLAILFLQSGLDKVLDWSGNRTYLKGYFEKSPLRRLPTVLLLLLILGLELLAGIFSAAGALAVLVGMGPMLAFIGAVFAALSLLSLFLGQRLAKDYAGAANMVPYVLASVAALLLLGAR